MKKWLLLLNSLILSFSVHAADTWKEIEQKAKGQTVYFHAWGKPRDK